MARVHTFGQISGFTQVLGRRTKCTGRVRSYGRMVVSIQGYLFEVDLRNMRTIRSMVKVYLSGLMDENISELGLAVLNEPVYEVDNMELEFTTWLRVK